MAYRVECKEYRMATRKIAPREPVEETPGVFSGKDEREEDEEVILSSSPEGKPRTAQELYRALVENGFIGMWKDRTDIGDSVEYARKLRERASKRRHD